LPQPYRIQALVGKKIKFVASGAAAAHIVCIDMEGKLMAWGRNEVSLPAYCLTKWSCNTLCCSSTGCTCCQPMQVRCVIMWPCYNPGRSLESSTASDLAMPCKHDTSHIHEYRGRQHAEAAIGTGRPQTEEHALRSAWTGRKNLCVRCLRQASHGGNNRGWKITLLGIQRDGSDRHLRSEAMDTCALLFVP
jgi:hypothetical protein